MKTEDKVLLFLEYLAYAAALITVPFIGIVNSKGATGRVGILLFAVILLVFCGIDAKMTRNNKTLKIYKKIEMVKLLNLKMIK